MRFKNISTAITLGATLVTTFGAGAAVATLASNGTPSNADIKIVREHGGIPACKHEDGSDQTGPCYWDASERGNGEGRDYVAMPAKGGDDRIVFLTPKRK